MSIKERLRPLKKVLRGCYWKVRRAISPPKLPANADGRVMIHLGCGPINAQGYTNVDAQPFPHIHFVHAAYQLEIINSESVDLIYASHILEHFSWHETLKVLKEWRRVLKPGGILRLGVPDFPTLLQIYQDTCDLNKIYGPLMGGQYDSLNIHYAVFDQISLSEMLRTVGFREIQKWNPETVDNHDFHDTTSKVLTIKGRDYAISLNLEAKK